MIPRSALDGLPILEGLTTEALAALAGRGIERRYATAEVLFRADDGSRGLFVVLGGRVRVVRQTVGRGQVVHLEGRGGTLGEVPLFTGTPYPATATATEPTRCLVFNHDAVRAAISADPEFALRLLAGLALRVRGLIARMDRLVFTSVRTRLAAWIAERAKRSVGPVVSLGMTHSELAEELGTVREVVVKELAALRRAGVVRSRGAGRIEVVDSEALKAAVSGNAPSRRRGRGPGGALRGGRRPSGGR